MNCFICKRKGKKDNFADKLTNIVNHEIPKDGNENLEDVDNLIDGLESIGNIFGVDLNLDVVKNTVDVIEAVE